jgi:3-oxoacyl-[acyl-carrier-protein] synthase III
MEAPIPLLNLRKEIIAMENEHLIRGNLLWESSRMMLPEHKEALLRQQQETKRQIAPILDEQEEARIFKVIADAYRLKIEVQIECYGEYQNEHHRGIVVSIDQILRRIKLNSGYETKWIQLANVIDVEFDLES